MAQLEFRCEKCGKLLRMQAQAGDNVVCSHCGQMVVAPNVSPAKPRPTPQVQPMNGVRPQPVANGQPGQPVQQGQQAEIALAEEGEPEEDDSLLAAMSFLMPWALSIVFHIGLLLVLLFVMTAGTGEKELEEITVPSHVWSDDPGVQDPKKSKSEEDMAKIEKVDMNQPAPEINQNIQPTTESRIVAIADSSNTSSMSAAFAGEGTGDKGCGFFGTKAGGNTRNIIFIVDSSGSMNTNFDFVKAELKRSISELGPMQRFTIIFFADGLPTEMQVDGKLGMVNATIPNIKAAQDWVQTHVAGSKHGKSLPAKSISRAFQLLGGQPGLIWILTDGLLLEDPDKLLLSLNSSKKVHVNTIGFVDRPEDGERLMKKMAAENGGKYKFVSEAELGR